MAKIESFTKERQLRIENETVISGFINDSGNLILQRRDGFTIDAGRVTGLKGDPGSGVRDVTVTYQGSSSGTVEPTGEWTSNVPPVASGNFLWVRTVTTYADPDDPENTFQTKTFTVVKQPEPGAPGDDGRGIFQIAIEYQSGASGVEPPTANWLPSIPTVNPGRFLWTRTVTVYTDSTSTVAYSVAKQGEDGSPGDPGNSNYMHVAYANNETGTEGFSTTDPSGRSYLGVYTDDQPQDSSDPSKYAWSLIKGANGIGVTSTVIRYQAGSSGTSVPTGVWLEFIPAVEDNQFLWTRTLMNFTDGASTTTYSVAKQGSKGLDGTPGISVSGVSTFYFLSASTPPKPTTISPPSPWTLVPTTYTVGETRNLYAVIRTIFSNNTFVYSSVVLDTAYTSAKAVHEAALGRDTALEEKALKAQTTADGRNRVYVQTIAPVTQTENPFTIGDMWYEIVVIDGETSINTINIWDGQKWAPYNLVANSLLVPGSINAELIAADAIKGLRLEGNQIIGGQVSGAMYDLTGYSTDNVFTYTNTMDTLSDWSSSHTITRDTLAPNTAPASIRLTKKVGVSGDARMSTPIAPSRDLPLSGSIMCYSNVAQTVGIQFHARSGQYMSSHIKQDIPANVWTELFFSVGHLGYTFDVGSTWSSISLTHSGVDNSYVKFDNLTITATQDDARRFAILRNSGGGPQLQFTDAGRTRVLLHAGAAGGASPTFQITSADDSNLCAMFPNEYGLHQRSGTSLNRVMSLMADGLAWTGTNPITGHRITSSGLMGMTMQTTGTGTLAALILRSNQQIRLMPGVGKPVEVKGDISFEGLAKFTSDIDWSEGDISTDLLVLYRGLLTVKKWGPVVNLIYNSSTASGTFAVGSTTIGTIRAALRPAVDGNRGAVSLTGGHPGYLAIGADGRLSISQQSGAVRDNASSSLTYFVA